MSSPVSGPMSYVKASVYANAGNTCVYANDHTGTHPSQSDVHHYTLHPAATPSLIRVVLEVITPALFRVGSPGSHECICANNCAPSPHYILTTHTHVHTHTHSYIRTHTHNTHTITLYHTDAHRLTRTLTHSHTHTSITHTHTNTPAHRTPTHTHAHPLTHTPHTDSHARTHAHARARS